MDRAALIAVVIAFFSGGCSCQREASPGSPGPPAARRAPAPRPAPEPVAVHPVRPEPQPVSAPAHDGPADPPPATATFAAVTADGAAPAAPQDAEPAAALEAPGREWGIEVLGIQLSAAGHMLDLRIRVLDPDKAKSLLARDVRPWLLDQESGLKSKVPTAPRVGQLRQHTESPDTERIYFALFQNPGRRVRPGSLVTVGLGECVLENLRVSR